MKFLSLLAIAFFFITCQTYDLGIIYHKDFVPGVNDQLRFEGYYTDTLGPKGAIKKVKPVFFYKNGSVFSGDTYEDFPSIENQVKTNVLKGSWGNYLITADTIELEKFQLIENNYVRIILRGVISKDKIHWTSRKFHREKYKPVDYSILFTPFSSKPDSTKNFTRTLPIYNKK